EYNLKSQDNGVYIMVVEGAIEINDTTLSYRDAIAITQTHSITINASENAEVLLIEVPMEL
ncbi:pirin family protein, partial [Nonlabens antarcticus]